MKLCVHFLFMWRFHMGRFGSVLSPILSRYLHHKDANNNGLIYASAIGRLHICRYFRIQRVKAEYRLQLTY